MKNSSAAKANYRVVFLHIIGCLTFLSIPVFSGPQGGNPFAVKHDSQYYNEILEYLLTILFFYVNYYYLIPAFYFKRRYALFTVLAIIGFVIVSTLPEMLPYNGYLHPMPPPDEAPFGPPPPMGHDSGIAWGVFGPFDENFLKYMAVFILAIALKVTDQLKKIQKEKAEAEIMFLKAQINPHFLFNTLNSVYTLAIEAGANSAAKAIAQLSGMMRYSTSEASSEKVLLAKELAYIDNYITLQRLRLNDRVKLFYAVEGNAGEELVAPFLLIPFIENAFKYGVSTDQDSDIRIRIVIEEGSLNLSVVNNKVYIATNQEHGTSIGIENTQRRLGLLYPQAYDLTINSTEKTFEVAMKITL